MPRKFSFYMVTPDGKHLRSECELLSVDSASGRLGIMCGHAPMEAILDIGELAVHNDGVIEYYALGGGILHITKEEIVILADSFESQKEIDIRRAEEAKMRAENRLSEHENIDVKRAGIALRKALNRLTIASK